MALRRLSLPWIVLAFLAALLPLGVRADSSLPPPPPPVVEEPQVFAAGQQFDPGGQSIEGAIFECINIPEQKNIYLPSPADLGQVSLTRTPGADVTVVYSGAWPVEAQAAFERAVATWENMVVTTAPIRLSATWGPLPGNVLGQGGPRLWGNFTGAPIANTWYPAALGNALCNCDLGGSTDFEMSVTMNSNFAHWWYDTEPAEQNKVDFETTALHEVTHGFGFAGSATVNNNLGYHGFGGLPFAYDRFVEDNAGAAITSYASGTAGLATVLQSGNVYFDGPNTRSANGGDRAPLYAPASWAGGSSYSHLGNIYDGTADALITYQLSYGESLRSLGPVTKGIFQDIGWTFAPEVPSPGTVQFSAATFNVSETASTLNVPVTRTGGTSGAASATCAVTGGTATGNGTDYALATSAVSWIDGEATTKNCVITLFNDADVESNETITLALQSVTGASLGSPSSTTVTVTSDDVAPAGTLQFTSATFAVTEGTATVNISVSRTGGSNGAASAVCSVVAGGTATSGVDFSLTGASVSWTNGDTVTKNCVITVTNDSAYEASETVNLSLGSFNGATAGSQTTAVLTITSEDAPVSGTLAFSAASYTQAEATPSLSVTVTRTGGTNLAASATCAITGGTATLDSDFTVGTSTLSWNDGESGSKTCTFALINDTAYEGAETITLQLQGLVNAGLGAQSTTTVNITSEDVAARGVLQFSSATYGVTEGTAQLSITVTRTGGSDLTASATCATTAGGTATLTSDYTWQTTSVSWTNGDSAVKTCVMNIVDDSAFESAETVNIALQSITGASAGSPTAAVVTITSNDAASPGTLQIGAGTYSVGEGTASLNIPVSRTGGTDGAVGVSCAVTGGTATGGGADYTLTTSILSWANGESTTKNCVIAITSETLVEPDETIAIQLTSPTGGATVGATGSTTVTITNDDNAGVVQFAAAGFGPIAETGTTLIFTLSRTGGTSGAVTATCSAHGSSTATLGSDYSISTASVSWTNGDAANKNCVILVSDDVLTEGTETIVLQVAITAGQAGIGTNGTALANITDNDNAGSVQFGAATYFVAENGTFVDLPVTRSGGTTGAVSVTCAVSGGTASGGDYSLSNATLTWANGESGAKTCRVTPVNDADVEPDETVDVSLGSATNGLVLGATNATTVTITNDDSAGTIQFAGATASVAENGTFVDVQVTRTNGTSGAASATCSVTGGTASGGDFTLSNATVSWAAGETGTKTCRITPVNDSEVEANETVVLSLDSITGASAGGLLTATVTITNDDSAGVLQFSAASYTAVSEGAGTATFTVTRTGGSAGAVGAICTIDVTSTATGADFSLSNGLVSFADGDTAAKTCTVAITDDSLVESSETMGLRLSDPSGGASLGSQVTASIAIADNDNAGTVAFKQSSFTAVSEVSGTATFIVVRSGGSSGAVTATCSPHVTSTATAGVDFTFNVATVSWADGEAGERECLLDIVDDTSVEGPELIALQLGSLSGQASLAQPTTSSMVLTENDSAGTLQFASATYSVSEGGTFVDLEVTRTGGSSGGLSIVCVATVAGTAHASDYTLTGVSLGWAHGETGSKSCRITPVDDTDLEGDETVFVQLANIAGLGTYGFPTTTMVTIVNDDSGGTVGFVSATASGAENGGPILVAVNRSGGNQGAISASCAVTGGSAVQGTHFSLSDTVSWQAGDSSPKTCSITPVDDPGTNDPRTVVLSLQGISGAGLDGDHASVTITITDDDGDASGLAFSAEPSSGDTDGVFEVQPVVGLVNGSGTPVSGEATVTLEIDPDSIAGHAGAVTLTCAGGNSRVAANGVASFDGCFVTAFGGIVGLRLRATADGLETALTAAFDIFDHKNDADCDGLITVSDSLALMRTMAGMTGGVSVQAPCTGDFNGDEEVSLADIIAIRRFIAGIQ